MPKHYVVTILAVVALAGVVVVRSGRDRGTPPGVDANVFTATADRMSPHRVEFSLGVEPLPFEVDTDPAKVAIGRRLFHDRGLSSDGSTSCATCHDLANGGDDGRQTSVGVGGQQGTVNAPTVWNVRYQFRFFWDGRAKSLEDQVEGPLTNPVEMGMKWPEVLEYLRNDDAYATEFAAAYPDGLTAENVKHSIAEFERTLITPNCRFDKFLRGDLAALTAAETRGWGLFQEIGCVSCHQGVNLGGNSFQTFGVAGDYFASRGRETPADQGRFNVTGIERDRHRFKVPTLRNVAETAPYLHDGEAATLDDAVQIMARDQLGVELKEAEVRDLVAFLNTLSGSCQDR